LFYCIRSESHRCFRKNQDGTAAFFYGNDQQQTWFLVDGTTGNKALGNEVEYVVEFQNGQFFYVRMKFKSLLLSQSSISSLQMRYKLFWRGFMAAATYKVHRRFDRIARLTGFDGMKRLTDSHVMVIGLGGVGSFAAESLIRSGVGRVSLVDFDMVCVTNSNRQLQALRGNVGKLKANVLADRLRLINPQAEIKAVPLFYDKRTADLLLKGQRRPDYVVDAIDNVTAKCHLINTCKELNIPLVVSTGASGRWNPTAVDVADLSKTTVDPLAATVRKILRRQYDFPRYGKWGIPAVFSTESLQEPITLPYDHNGEFQCVCPSGENTYHNCEERNVIWGTAGFVTGVFGLTCASIVVRELVEKVEGK
jgi:tRNA A37 threonylcarbamoyladenosine dehydratase